MPAESALLGPVAHLKRLFRRRGFVRVNPKYRQTVADWGLESPEQFLDLEGEIVTGHPDRHVMRLELGSGGARLDVYLKREHHVPWKDRWASLRAGFGFVSVSCREATILRLLEHNGIPVADWIAVGESADGRAFLLLRAVDGALDLRRYLHEARELPARERRALARTLGRLLARMHHRGFEYPDLYGKHILVQPGSEVAALLDWQRSRLPRRLSWRTRCRDLAALNASLADDLAGPTDRFALLLAYLRATGPGRPRFSTICRRIEDRSRRLQRRSSLREQRLPAYRDSQPLLWIDGEAICATRQGLQLIGEADLRRLAKLPSPGKGSLFLKTELMLPDGRMGVLVCRRTVRVLASIWDWLSGRRWTSPEARQAAQLLRLERLGHDEPRLLAFGQRFLTGGVAESFLLVVAKRPSPSERRHQA